LSSDVMFGVDLSLEGYEVETWERYFSFIRHVDDNVWDSIWLGDHLGGLPPLIPTRNYNVWLIFSLLAEFKRKPLLGTAVTDPHRYHPAVLAQMAMTVDHISNGRFILGLGAGEAFNLESYGFDYRRPVTKMVEFVDVLRKLWSSGGKPVSHEGAFFKLKDAVLEPAPTRKIPVWIAANSPRTRKLAGMIADGWIPLPFSPETYRDGMKEVEAGLKEAGRSRDEFTFAYWNWVFIHEDEEALQNYLGLKKLSFPVQFPKEFMASEFWREEKRKLYKRMGFEPEKLSLLSFSSVDQLDLGVLGQLVEDVPDSFVRDATLMGTKDEVTGKLEKLVRAGAQHIVLMIDNDVAKDPRNPEPYTYEHVYETLTGEIVPYLKEQYR